MNGSPPWNSKTWWPSARIAITRLRIWTISEKPTRSKRRAVWSWEVVVLIGRTQQYIGEKLKVSPPRGLRAAMRAFGYLKVVVRRTGGDHLAAFRAERAQQRRILRKRMVGEIRVRTRLGSL